MGLGKLSKGIFPVIIIWTGGELQLTTILEKVFEFRRNASAEVFGEGIALACMNKIQDRIGIRIPINCPGEPTWGEEVNQDMCHCFHVVAACWFCDVFSKW